MTANKTDQLDNNKQKYSDDPLNDRDTDHYIGEYISEFVNKWDELIDGRRVQKAKVNSS